MESKNLDIAIMSIQNAMLLCNTMMNVNRGLEEIKLLFEDEPAFLEDEDVDEFNVMATEFDYLTELFRVWEQRYTRGWFIDMMELDKIANHLDLIRHYFENINNLY